MSKKVLITYSRSYLYEVDEIVERVKSKYPDLTVDSLMSDENELEELATEVAGEDFESDWRLINPLDSDDFAVRVDADY